MILWYAIKATFVSSKRSDKALHPLMSAYAILRGFPLVLGYVTPRQVKTKQVQHYLPTPWLHGGHHLCKRRTWPCCGAQDGDPAAWGAGRAWGHAGNRGQDPAGDLIPSHAHRSKGRHLLENTLKIRTSDAFTARKARSFSTCALQTTKPSYWNYGYVTR